MADIDRKDPLWGKLNDDDGDGDYWKPEVGDAVLGVVTKVEILPSQHDPETPVLTINDEITGEVVCVWCFWTVLRGKIIQLGPQPGDRLGIRRLADSDRGYRRFRVVTDRAPGAVDWSDLGRPEPSDSPDDTEGPDDDDLPF